MAHCINHSSKSSPYSCYFCHRTFCVECLKGKVGKSLSHCRNKLCLATFKRYTVGVNVDLILKGNVTEDKVSNGLKSEGLPDDEVAEIMVGIRERISEQPFLDIADKNIREGLQEDKIVQRLLEAGTEMETAKTFLAKAHKRIREREIEDKVKELFASGKNYQEVLTALGNEKIPPKSIAEVVLLQGWQNLNNVGHPFEACMMFTLIGIGGGILLVTMAANKKGYEGLVLAGIGAILFGLWHALKAWTGHNTIRAYKQSATSVLESYSE